VNRRTSLLLVILVTMQGFDPAAAQESRMSLDDAIRGYESVTHSAFRGLPEDWSSHHLLFSHPKRGSAVESAAQRDPRYWLQQIRQGMSAGAGSALAVLDAKARRRRRRVKRDWSEFLGSGATVGNGQFPAKFSFTANGSPSCTNDFVVFNTGLTGTSAQASILAYNELYKAPTCSGSIPASLWAFDTGGAITTSPVLSLDGSQVAFVQTSGGVASLVVLKWAAGGTVTSPTTLSSNSSYPGCTAPCMISLTFQGSPNDTTSAPFYDYSGSDTLFVGDAAGIYTNSIRFSPVRRRKLPAAAFR